MKTKLNCPNCLRVCKFTISIYENMYCPICVAEFVEEVQARNQQLVQEILDLKKTLLENTIKNDDLVIESFKQSHATLTAELQQQIHKRKKIKRVKELIEKAKTINK